MTEPPPTGRFAPSPTGPLHFGSLIAAVASWLDARAAGGRWLVRIEDIDTPRTVTGAADTILRQLDAHGLHADGPVVYQSSRLDAYRAALQRLAERDLIFRCDCSRSQLRFRGGIYPGTCRHRRGAADGPHALRVEVDATTIAFDDLIQGLQSQRLDRDVGDFVVRRRDGLFAYQLAVVVDDADQGVTRICRGADLLDSTARQIWLQRQLGLPTPAYAHVPVAIDEYGQKLSKQNLAPELFSAQAARNLRCVLDFLGQPEPPVDAREPHAILAAALKQFDPTHIAAVVERRP